MKKTVLFLILISSLNIFSQENISIKGKLFFSDDFYRTFTNLLVKIEDSDNYIKINEDGKFTIKTSLKKENYKLGFYYGNLKFKEFSYKFKWIKRKKPKSISLAGKCELNKSIARKDYKEKKLKLFLFNSNQALDLSRKDKRFQKKNKIKYVNISVNNLKSYDCYMKYNKKVFVILSINGKKKINKMRKDVIGYNYRYNKD